MRRSPFGISVECDSYKAVCHWWRCEYQLHLFIYVVCYLRRGKTVNACSYLSICDCVCCFFSDDSPLNRLFLTRFTLIIKIRYMLSNLKFVFFLKENKNTFIFTLLRIVNNVIRNIEWNWLKILAYIHILTSSNTQWFPMNIPSKKNW